MNQLQKINKSSAADIGLSFVLQMVQDLGPPDLSVPDVCPLRPSYSQRFR
jgi:hypothetical protein